MECARIKELLSEYIDGTLDTQAKATVEKHVLTCKGCKEELASLQALVEELGSLESTKAPADFLEKIHKRMESRFGFGKVLRKLFVPFHIKFPLELAAVATMAILVFSVLNIQQAEKQMAQIPKVSTAPSIPEEASARRKAEKRLMIAKKSAVKAVKPAPQRGVESIELALLVKREVVGRGSAPRVAMKAVPAPKKEAKKALEEDKTYIAYREVTSTLEGRVKHLIGFVEGKVLDIEYEKQSKVLKSIYVEIPAKRYESFCEELTRLAALRDPPPILSDKVQEMIKIRIRFIAPDS